MIVENVAGDAEEEGLEAPLIADPAAGLEAGEEGPLDEIVGLGASLVVEEAEHRAVVPTEQPLAAAVVAGLPRLEELKVVHGSMIPPGRRASPDDERSSAGKKSRGS